MRLSGYTPIALFVITSGVAACATSETSEEEGSLIVDGRSVSTTSQALTQTQRREAFAACVRHVAFKVTTLAPLNFDGDDFDDTPENRGRRKFNDRTPVGNNHSNGRACADCHMGSDSFQLSPANASARYDALEGCRVIAPWADDPLFRPIDANDFRTNGENASDYTNLRAGLVRITFPLPPNVKLIDPATGQPTNETSVDVWRMVPSIFNVAITGADNGFAQPTGGPNPRGGYQLDGRVLTLQDQALGAFQNHAQTQLVPPQGVLDDLAAFQNAQFSSPAVANLAASILSGSTPFPDPDPVLNDLEQQGKSVFQRSCATCHGNAGHPSTTTPLPGVLRYSNIATKCPAPAIPGGDIAFKPCGAVQTANARFYRTTFNGAVINHPPTDDPGRLLLTGHPADFNAFDTTDLHGISKTAPYFHNNRSATLEDVVDHYFAFFVFLSRVNPPGRFPAPISSNGSALDRTFTAEEKPALVAYLNKL
jgi:hypothetical protein